jgi:hypothetical protein
MRKATKLFLLNLAISIAGLASPELARGQYIGAISMQTVSQTLANNIACTGSAQVFVVSNLGQTSHLATAVSTAAAFQMEIDGLDRLGNAFRLSDLQLGVPSSAKGGIIVQATGYMPIIQVNATCTAGATMSLSYSGSFSAPIPNFGPALLNAVDKLPFQTAAANASSAVTFQTPNGSSAGTIIFQYAATGPAGSTINAQCLSNAGTNLSSYNFMLATASAAQLFIVTPSTCPFVTLTYTSGGASATTYTLEYAFNTAGTTATLTTPNTGPSATAPIQVVSDALAQAFFAADTFTNPGATAFAGINANNGSRTLYLSDVVVSCTAACGFFFSVENGLGTGCTLFPVTNLKLGSAVTATGQTLTNCGVNPLQGNNIAVVNLAANTPFDLDLKGAILPAGTTQGVGAYIVGAVTGSVTVAYRWYEK